MGAHSKPRKAHGSTFMGVYDAVVWIAKNRRKVYAALVVLLPLAARLVPGFPADALLDACKVFLGA